MQTVIGVEKRVQNDILIFTFSGELDETNVDIPFKKIHEQIEGSPHKKVIFNLSGLEYLNSKSIGYIANSSAIIEESDGKMYISNCNKSIIDILGLVGISIVIPVVPDENDAILKLQ